ncbi:MAG: hypothetical protein HY678_06285 [Chloroflexi bacterium]|nr:hypothetical protein [Chloroflexota bacterium]
MGIGIGIVLALGVIAVIAWPFIRLRRIAAIRAPANKPDSARQLHRARMEVYQQARQIQADYDEGLMDEADFRAQLDELKLTAARLLKREAELGIEVKPATGGSPAEPQYVAVDAITELENEIAAARASLERDALKAHSRKASRK